MRQVIVGSGGSIVVADVPRPVVGPHEVLISTEFSLISPGTESSARRSSGGAAALAVRAMSDPALRAKALDRLRSQGVKGAYEQAEARAARATLLGYSAAGRVLQVGERVDDIAIGQRVAAAGAEHASHAETISVPRALVSPVPEGVAVEDAAYTTLAAIALHAHRLSRIGLGETLAVVGLGLVGQLGVRIAAAAGCRVFGTDLRRWRCDRARKSVPSGIFARTVVDLAAAADDATEGSGVDAIVIAAGGSDAGLVNSCLALARDRARVVVVGAVPLSLNRDALYRKELEITVSRSYGPGRYDRDYEELGIDYPVGYVRWTEGRNLAAVLDLMARGTLDVAALTTDIVPVEDAPRAYELAGQGDGHLGVLLSYTGAGSEVEVNRARPRATVAPMTTESPEPSGRVPAGPIRLGLIGPGSFALSVLAPIIRNSADIECALVVAPRPVHAQAASRAFRATTANADVGAAISNPSIHAVVIATRHDTHAELSRRALDAGKHVFVEKPLGLTLDDCDEVVRAANASGRVLMVDFNRRFSPLAMALKQDLSSVASGAAAIYRVNAGTLRADHWLLDPTRGGGRIRGEAVHFLDLLCWLFDSDPVEVLASPSAVVDSRQEVVCTLVFPGGRSGTLIYSAHGSPRISKERLEVHASGHTWILDDYRTLERDGKRVIRGRQRKGHAEAIRNFVEAVRGREQPGVTALDGLRATRLALEVQGRAAAVRSP